MTYNELKAQVAGLGFERTVSDDDSLLRATERALSILHLDLPRPRTKRIYIRAPKLTKVYKTIYHNGGESEEFDLCGTAFSFRPHGDGEYLIFEGDTATRVKFFAANGVVKSVLSGTAKIRFEGDFDYIVTSLASFGGKYDVSLSDVCEYAEKREIQIGDMIDDFSALAERPVCIGSKTSVAEIVTRGGVLYLPFLFDGEIEISYFPRPMPPKKNAEDLDIPSGAEHLFPLLVASFIWLDDDEGKAQYYMALYRDGINRLIRITPSERCEKYPTNGWA